MREHLIGPIVYRLGRHPFTVQRGVRFPYGLRREQGVVKFDEHVVIGHSAIRPFGRSAVRPFVARGA